MTINLADNSPRISYTVGQGVTQTSFAVPFEFFDNGDLNVYVDGTLKTITTHYTVTGGDGSTGTVSMSVTGGTGGSTVVITRDIALERTTDFPVSGAFNIVSLNTELDRLVAVAADLDDRASRALQLTDFDAAVSLVLPEVDTRKGKTLAFNASTGAVEAGPSISDTQTVSAASTDIALLADIQDGTTATNAITTVASNNSNVTTVAGISANVTTVAGISSDVTAVAADATDIGTVATNIASVNTVATNIADVITVANDLTEAVSEVETVANDLNEAVSEIDTVAGSITNVDTVGSGITNVNTVATNISNVNTVAGISANVTTVAGINSDVTTVAGISSNVTAVAGDATDIGTVATNISNVNTVAGNNTNITTVAGISSNVTTVAGISANVTTVAGDTTNIGTIATNLGGTDTIGTVAGSISNVNTVGGAIANVNTVATNISGVNSFAERYRVGSSDPTTSLDAGDLAFNTTDSGFKFYDGSSWQTVNVSGIGNIVEDTTPQLGGNLDTNGNEIAFDDGSSTTNRLKFGASDDLQIYYDSSGDANIISGNGGNATTDTIIYTNDNFRIRKGTPSSHENLLYALGDGSVGLLHDGSTKFATTSTGADITGTLTADYVDASPTLRASSDNSGSQGSKYLKLATINAGTPSTAGSFIIIDLILEGRNDPQGCQAFRFYLRAGNTASNSFFEVEDLRVQNYSSVSSLYSAGYFHWYWNSQTNQELWIQLPNNGDTAYQEAFTRLVLAPSQDTDYVSGYEDLTLLTGQSWTTSAPSGTNRITASFVTKRFEDIHLDNGIAYAPDLTKKIEFNTLGSDIFVDVSGEFKADSYNETYNTVTSSSNTTTVNCHFANAFAHTLTENTTFAFNNPPPSGTAFSFSLEIIQDSSASGYTVTWPTSVDWPSATAPTLTATASAKDVFVFYTRDGGTNWYGFTAGQALG